MTRSSPQTPYLKVSVVLQTRDNQRGAAFDALLKEGLAVLTKTMVVLTDVPLEEGAYDLEVLVRDDSIILKGCVMPSQMSAPAPQLNLSAEEMQALFEISA